ncbi:MAG: hypothetical protein U9Q33_04160 [Campylobacterota bacterium]|nr:hypothetical protein [Campylobacterota bacterium]
MNFKNYFEKLTTVQKTEVYIIVLILYIILYSYSDKLFVKEKQNPVNKDTVKYDKKIKELKRKITKKEQNLIFRVIEENIQQYQINTKYIKFNNKLCSLSLEGKFQNILNFLNYISKHFKITQLKIYKQDKILLCDIELNITYFYDPYIKIAMIENTPNPFSQKKRTNNTYRKTAYTLNAVIKDELFINNKWYKTGDKIDNYIIKDAHSDNVILEHIKNKKLLHLKIDQIKSIWSKDE